MPGLQDSRWALRDTRSSSVPAPYRHSLEASRGKPNEAATAHLGSVLCGVEPAAAELTRYSKIVRRMKWKLPFLDLAYRQATSSPDEHGTSRPEAELMFKLDFFEYYMLCERALVHLQGVFGITISRGFASGAGVPAIDIARRTPPHRYHANVLEALDREDNPFHDVLGSGDVRWQLARAKDLRNRWKDADDDGSKPPGNHNRKTSPLPLATYDLAGILTSIHGGFDRAFIIAENFVAAEASQSDSARAGVSDVDKDPSSTEEEQWGFMVEAMDWEAV